MTPQEALQTLEERATHLETVAYDEIMYLLQHGIRRIPIPVARLFRGALIDRVRPNIGENLFTSVDELTYIKNEQVIRERLTEFGRGNCPHQPMFYGAIETTEIPEQRITALAETSTLYQDPAGINLEGELYTVSRWRTTQELQVVEMVFSPGAIAASPDTERAFHNQVALLAAHGLGDEAFLRKFLVFISGQFARPKRTHHDYKISAAYTNAVLRHPDINGVSYPSVQTEYKGWNLVLPPSTVEQHLTLESTITQRLHKNAPHMYINNHMECIDPLRDPHQLNWLPTDPIHIAVPEEIHAALFPPQV
ncbi:hypothetical protein ACFS5N_05975 [Mucilaginibacter ximonensis]|uniref:RES domain-containing protein n=1 Tax=Mucilaginibacter ximonensis TaxID=538021 RepID=A0ABW5Y9L7_9SPHI